MTPERRQQLLSTTRLGRLVAFGHEQPPDPVGSPPVTFGFNPDQERASNGKFGSGGASGGEKEGGAKKEKAAKTPNPDAAHEKTYKAVKAGKDVSGEAVAAAHQHFEASHKKSAAAAADLAERKGGATKLWGDDRKQHDAHGKAAATARKRADALRDALPAAPKKGIDLAKVGQALKNDPVLKQKGKELQESLTKAKAAPKKGIDLKKVGETLKNDPTLKKLGKKLQESIPKAKAGKGAGKKRA